MLLYSELVKNIFQNVLIFDFTVYICRIKSLQTIQSFIMKKFTSEMAKMNTNNMLCMGMCMCHSYAIQEMCRI